MPGRVFVAIELPAPTRALLTSAIASFIAADPTWAEEKPVAVGLLHVTLAFVGSVPDAGLPELVARLSVAAACSAPFGLRISGVRAVPNAGRASMIWATMEGDTNEAAALAERLARGAHLPPDPRPWAAHITLVRSRHPRAADGRAVSAAAAILSASGKEAERTVSVRSATVFSSTLGSRGPAYEPLTRISLGTAAGHGGPD